MIATTIDEVLSQLTVLITESRQKGDRSGYFAALYYKVTAKVKEGIQKGQFEDGARMEKLDVLFANRYLDAYAIWKAGKVPTASWTIAFEACQRRSVLVLQHLLLGISAHINFDLGIAAVETMAGGDLGAIEKDFDNINIILGAMTYEVINDINRLSPLLSLIGKHSKNTESVLVQFSMSNARDGAWCFAEDLFKVSAGAPVSGAGQGGVAGAAPLVPGQDAYAALIAARDKDIAKLGHTLVHFRAMLKLTVWFIHLFECKNVQRVIDVLQDPQKTFIHVSPGI
jgi:hypothetical protein